MDDTGKQRGTPSTRLITIRIYIILVSTARKETMHTCKNAHGNRKCGDGMERDNLLRIIYLPYHQLFGCHKCLFDHIRSLMKKTYSLPFCRYKALICVMRRLNLVLQKFFPAPAGTRKSSSSRKMDGSISAFGLTCMVKPNIVRRSAERISGSSDRSVWNHFRAIAAPSAEEDN